MIWPTVFLYNIDAYALMSVGFRFRRCDLHVWYLFAPTPGDFCHCRHFVCTTYVVGISICFVYSIDVHMSIS
jgi:hypothetical protein